MNGVRRALILGVAAASLGALWLFGTGAGRAWHKSRSSTADLTAYALSHPSSPAAQRSLGERLLDEHRFEEAAGAFAAGAAADPSSWDLGMWQARALTRAGRPVEAIEVLQAGNRGATLRNAAEYCAAGEAYYAAGVPNAAVSSLRRGLEMDGSLAWCWASLAFALADSHKLDDAKRAADQAVEKGPRSSLSWAALGYAHETAGSAELALSAYRRAVSLDSRDGRSAEFMALLLAKTTRSMEGWPAASAALDRAEALNRGSPKIPYARGLLAMQLGRHSEAVRHLGAAVDLSPGFTDALYNLSRALRFAGDYQKSEQVARRFVRARDYLREVTNLSMRAERDRTNSALWRRIADLAESRGDVVRARSARWRIRRIQDKTLP